MSNSSLKPLAHSLGLTSTVVEGKHFDDVRKLAELLESDELTSDIICNRWIVSQMLKLEATWDDDACALYQLLHQQLIQNLTC